MLQDLIFAGDKVFKNYVVFAPEYESEIHIDELGKDFQVVSSRLFS